MGDPVLADRLAVRAAELAGVVKDSITRLRALLFQLRLQPHLTRADLSPAVRASIGETFKEVMRLGLTRDQSLLREVARALAGEQPDLFFVAFRAAGFGRLTFETFVTTIRALRKWAKESGHFERILSIVSRSGPTAARLLLAGEGERAIPRTSARQLGAILDELLAEMPNDLALQRVVALALEGPTEQVQ